MAIADLLALNSEIVDESQPLELFNPVYTWKRKKVKNYYVKELLVKIFDHGKAVYTSPSVLEIKEFSQKETSKLWPEVLRFENPHTYYVDLSKDLWDLKHSLLHNLSSNFEE